MTNNPGDRILRSPLFHFALAGVLLFALASVFDLGGLGAWRRNSFGGAGGGENGPGSVTGGEGAGREAAGSGCAAADDPATICVGRDALLAFIQSQTRMARVEEAAAAFDAAAEPVRRDWIDRFVREEALVREARALGLDRSDELVQRRLVQQMEFLVEGAGESALDVTDAEIEAAYRARAREFRHPALFRFAHVFIQDVEGYESESVVRAKGIRDAMNEDGISFDEGFPYGDPFLYERVYVDRSRDEIESHFGEEFVKTLAKLEPTPGRWTGPYHSEHGLHLLMLVEQQPARDSSLEEVRSELREELLREKRDRAIERGVAAIVAKYRVAFEGGIEPPKAAGAKP